MERQILLKNLGLRDLNPLICGWQSCAPGHSFGPATRSYLLLHYVLSGSGCFESGGEKFHLCRGQMFVIHPGEVTYYQADSADPWSYCWIGFESSLTLPECLSYPVVDAQNCGHIFRAICHEDIKSEGREWYVNGKLFELLSLLSERQDDTSAAHQYVLRAKNYMENSYMEQVTVARTASYLGLNRSYFCRLFHKYQGDSPGRYLLELRLRHAAELLSSGGRAVCEVALSCGYSDPAGFSRAFRKQFGMPPSAYGSGQEKQRTGAEAD